MLLRPCAILAVIEGCSCAHRGRRPQPRWAQAPPRVALCWHPPDDGGAL